MKLYCSIRLPRGPTGDQSVQKELYGFEIERTIIRVCIYRFEIELKYLIFLLKSYNKV